MSKLFSIVAIALLYFIVGFLRRVLMWVRLRQEIRRLRRTPKPERVNWMMAFFFLPSDLLFYGLDKLLGRDIASAAAEKLEGWKEHQEYLKRDRRWKREEPAGKAAQARIEREIATDPIPPDLQELMGYLQTAAAVMTYGGDGPFTPTSSPSSRTFQTAEQAVRVVAHWRKDQQARGNTVDIRKEQNGVLVITKKFRGEIHEQWALSRQGEQAFLYYLFWQR